MTGVGITFAEAHVATMVSVVNWWRTLFEESIFGKQNVLVLAEKLVAVGES